MAHMYACCIEQSDEGSLSSENEVMQGGSQTLWHSQLVYIDAIHVHGQIVKDS